MALAASHLQCPRVPQGETASCAPEGALFAAWKSARQHLGSHARQESFNKSEWRREQHHNAQFWGELASTQYAPQPPNMPPPAAIEHSIHGNLGYLTADIGPAFELMCAKSLLGQGRVALARELLQQACSRYPMDERLRNLYRAIAPGTVAHSSAKVSDQTAETTWLRVHREQYKGKWVVLLGDQMLGVGTTFQEVLNLVQQQHLQASPLIHRID